MKTKVVVLSPSQPAVPVSKRLKELGPACQWRHL